MKLPELIAKLNAILDEEPENADSDVFIGMDSLLGFLYCDIDEIAGKDKAILFITPNFENLHARYKEGGNRKNKF